MKGNLSEWRGSIRFLRLPAQRGPIRAAVSRPRRLLLGGYFVLVLALLEYFRVAFGPDVLLFVLLGAAVIVGRVRLFVRDWGAFLLVLILWQQTELLAQWAGFPLHMADLISIDRALAAPLLHGQLPQEWLQQHLFHASYTVRTHYHDGYWSHGVYHHHPYWDHVYYPARYQWYDFLSVVIYALHFPLPLIVGFVLWLRHRALFQRFAMAFLTLAGIAFALYIVVPAVPPWMASRRTYNGQAFGAIPYLHKIFDDINYELSRSVGRHGVSLLKIQYNRTAAMPSLHAAFPLLSALYLRKSLGRWGLLMLGYGGIMWFAVVYLAEHWVVDVLAGLICAVLAYVLVEQASRYVATRRTASGARPRPAATESPAPGGAMEPPAPTDPSRM